MPPATPVAGRSLADLYPELAKEALFDASKVRPGCGKRLNWLCFKCRYEWSTSVNNRAYGGTGCPACGKRKRVAYVCSLDGCSRKGRAKGLCFYHYNKLIKYGSPIGDRKKPGILVTHPEYASQLVNSADAMSPYGSSKKVAWKCSNGHVYKATIANRIIGKCGCPKCKFVTVGVNDLLSVMPDLFRQIKDKDSNRYLTIGSNKKVEWVCDKCDRIYKARVCFRVSPGTGCPECAVSGFKKTYQDAYLYLLHKDGQQKVGITAFISNRIRKDHARNGWSCIDIKRVDPAAAEDIESQCLYVLDQIGIPRGSTAFRDKFDGWTESWQTVDWWADSLDCFRRELYTTVWDKVFSAC